MIECVVQVGLTLAMEARLCLLERLTIDTACDDDLFVSNGDNSLLTH